MNNTLKGMTMAGLAAVFWGSMGVAGQYLLQNCHFCLLYTSPSPRDRTRSRMPSSA